MPLSNMTPRSKYESPSRILAVRIDGDDIEATKAAPAPFGAIPPIYKARLKEPVISAGQSMCVLDYIQEENDMPSYLADPRVLIAILKNG